MPRYDYTQVSDRSFPLWEQYLEKISDAEAAKISDSANLPDPSVNGQIPSQEAYDLLMHRAASYVGKVK